MSAKIWPLLIWKSQWWQQWFRVAKSTNNLAKLGARQIYIVPTHWGFLYGIMLIALLIGSINYTLSLGFYITFLLASLGHVAMLHTWRNLAHLEVSVLETSPVFATDVCYVKIKISDVKNRTRYSISGFFEPEKIISEHISANQTQLFSVPFSTQKRGLRPLPPLRLHTQFPLNLLHAWAIVDNPLQVLVYPKPSDSELAQSHAIDTNAQGSSHFSAGDEEFNGHKNYQLGDSPSRVDWKASSRSVGMFTKLYSGAGSSTLWLDWAATNGDHETRISQLTRWVIDANAKQQNYGLRLPNLSLPPNNSMSHYHQALSALALLD